MDNLSAFIIGLALGETTNASKPSPPTRNRNIALQDVSFCQALRNLLDGIEDFVQKEKPSPEKFFDIFYGKPVFEEPYTEDEKKQIRDYEWEKESYLLWVKIIGRDKWDSMPTIYRIWKTEDVSHIPDVDNLDLLFALDDCQAPIKKNGRVYEYESISRRTAKGFFNSKLSQILYNKCVQCSQSILKQNGFDYDYSRFEYNKTLDKRPRFVVNEEQLQKNYKQEFRSWQIESREDAYYLLLRNYPSFALNTWSELTRRVQAFQRIEKQDSETHLNKVEIQRRKKEIRSIYKTLSFDEQKSYAAIAPKDEKIVDKTIAFLICAVITVVSFFVGICISSNEDNPASFALLTLSAVLCFLIMLNMLILGGYFKVIRYLRVIQSAYYNDTNPSLKQEYEQLLQRIKK